MLKVLICAVAFVIPSSAQQTIFNIPSTDVLARGKLYAELDASYKPSSQAAQRKFSSFVPRIVVGIGGRFEVGLNLTGNIQPGKDTTTIVPTIKWKAFENKKKSFALIAGSSFSLPLRKATYRFGTFSYLAGSQTFNKTRVTFGSFVASKNVFAPNAVRGGALVGVEQSLSQKIVLAADWISGRHTNGYLTPGLIYKPHPRVAAYFTYSIGNSNAVKGNHFFLFEIGYSIN
jgi:hypothetical protein